MSNFQRICLSRLLLQKKAVSDPSKLNVSIRSANIDLNPHQVDASLKEKLEMKFVVCEVATVQFSILS